MLLAPLRDPTIELIRLARISSISARVSGSTACLGKADKVVEVALVESTVELAVALWSVLVRVEAELAEASDVEEA
jgi:hypothetical protein